MNSGEEKTTLLCYTIQFLLERHDDELKLDRIELEKQRVIASVYSNTYFDSINYLYEQKISVVVHLSRSPCQAIQFR
jgi:hypothetical protein